MKDEALGIAPKLMDAICPVHGNVGGLSFVIIDNDRKFSLCMRCMAEKLVELGVQEIEFVERENEPHN